MIDGVWCSAVLWMLKQILTHFHTGFLLWMISLSLAFNSNSDFINLLLIVVGSKSQNKWEIVVFQPALQFFSCICGSLWRLMSLCIEERIVCLRSSIIVMYFFLSPRWCTLYLYEEKRKALQVCCSSSFWVRVFSDDAWKISVMCCYSLLMGNNNSTLYMCNCFALNFLKCIT